MLNSTSKYTFLTKRLAYQVALSRRPTCVNRTVIISYDFRESTAPLGLHSMMWLGRRYLSSVPSTLILAKSHPLVFFPDLQYRGFAKARWPKSNKMVVDHLLERTIEQLLGDGGLMRIEANKNLAMLNLISNINASNIFMKVE